MLMVWVKVVVKVAFQHTVGGRIGRKVASCARRRNGTLGKAVVIHHHRRRRHRAGIGRLGPTEGVWFFRYGRWHIGVGT
uniref:Putative secreted protein n=1 Tax=Anopheles triannulatus TaxID=58253 RepID=A0A2M4B465_9DIPT